MKMTTKWINKKFQI